MTTEELWHLAYCTLLGVWLTCAVIGIGAVAWIARERKKSYREYVERHKK